MLSCPRDHLADLESPLRVPETQVVETAAAVHPRAEASRLRAARHRLEARVLVAIAQQPDGRPRLVLCKELALDLEDDGGVVTLEGTRRSKQHVQLVPVTGRHRRRGQRRDATLSSGRGGAHPCTSIFMSATRSVPPWLCRASTTSSTVTTGTSSPISKSSAEAARPIF